MTNRFVNPRPQFFDAAGDPLVKGRMFFFESGTDIVKPVFADVNEDIPAPVDGDGAVPLSGDGRLPNIFYSGTARVILQNKPIEPNFIQVWDIDGVGTFGSGAAFDTWNSIVEYESGAYVVGSDGLVYKSLQNNNSNNDPTASPTFWEQVSFLRTWNPNITYALGDGGVVGSDGKQYRSLQAANTNNDPVSSPAFWGVNNPFDQSLNTTDSAVFAEVDAILGANTPAAATVTTVTANTSVVTDLISEKTSAVGVNIDGVLLKDFQVTTNVINERTAAAGVTADGVICKDGGITLTGLMNGLAIVNQSGAFSGSDRMGADSNATTVTNSTAKLGRIVGPHFTSATEEDVFLFGYSSNGTINDISIGGPAGGLNAATNIFSYTAANDTTLNGTLRTTVHSDGGFTVGSPTGGSQGAGKINATGVFDDGVLLTCYVPLAAQGLELNDAEWDAFAPDTVIKGIAEHEVQKTKLIEEEKTFVKEINGVPTLVKELVKKRVDVFDTVNVVDENGAVVLVEIEPAIKAQPASFDEDDKLVKEAVKAKKAVTAPMTYEKPVMITVPATEDVIIKRTHEGMRKFRERNQNPLTDPLDLDVYYSHFKEKGHLTSMPNRDKFNPERGLSVGEWAQRLIETVEIQAVHIEKLNQKDKDQQVLIDALVVKVEALENKG